MATRRKTKRFVKLREKFKRQRAKEASYSSRGGGVAMEGIPSIHSVKWIAFRQQQLATIVTTIAAVTPT